MAVRDTTPHVIHIDGMSSAAQLRILRVIDTYWRETGLAPSYRDVAERSGRSHQAVAIAVTRLLRDGAITQRPRVARSLRLTDEGQALLASGVRCAHCDTLVYG